MGVCTGKPKQIVQFKTNSLSVPKSSQENPKKILTQPVQLIEFKIDWTNDKEQIIESLLGDGMLFKLGLHQDIDDILCIPNDYQNSNLLDIALKISVKIKETENRVDEIQSQAAKNIMSSYKNTIMDQVQELSGENLQLLKNKGIPMDCLTITIFTYHVLMHYIQERINGFFNEEIIESLLTDRFNLLQGRISTEMINCYGKGNNQCEIQNLIQVNDPTIQRESPKKQTQNNQKLNEDDEKMKDEKMKDEKMRDEKIKDEKMKDDIKAVMHDLLDQVILQDSLENAFKSLDDMYDGSIDNKVKNLNQQNSVRSHTVKFSRLRID